MKKQGKNKKMYNIDFELAVRLTIRIMLIKLLLDVHFASKEEQNIKRIERICAFSVLHVQLLISLGKDHPKSSTKWSQMRRGLSHPSIA